MRWKKWAWRTRRRNIRPSCRAALARAVARQPQVLLLDEPFSALDAVIREQMQTMLREIVRRHNTAAVMVTHDIDEALLVSDRIVLVGAGGRMAA